MLALILGEHNSVVGKDRHKSREVFELLAERSLKVSSNKLSWLIIYKEKVT